MHRKPSRGDIARICDAALHARGRALAPFSRFKVGAALLTPDGELFTGCNVENSSYGLTICAERVALFTATSSGHRAFSALAVAADTDVLIPPCGACRQVISDLAGNIPIYLLNTSGRRRMVRLNELLPQAFGPKHLRSRH